MTAVELDFTSPLAAEALRAALRAHATPGLERQESGGAHVRALAAPGGPAVAELELADDVVWATLTLAHAGDRDWVVAALRRWLDLDADPAAVDAVLSTDRRLAPLVAARPGLRALGAVDPFETAVLAVLGQQVSVKAARTFGGRLIEAFGTPLEGGLGAFPSPATLVAAEPTEVQRSVGLTHARVRTVQALARAVADGLDLGADPADLREHLLAIPGIGPWTVDYLALRLGDRDAFPAGDLVLQRGLGVASAAEAEAAAEAWRPWRAYGLYHVWTEVAFLPRA